MRIKAQTFAIISVTFLTLLVLVDGTARVGAKDKTTQVSDNDPTVRLYNLLDTKYNGKLSDYYVLADVINDPKNPGQPQQHVIGLDYSKDRVFGKLMLHVRVVGQVTPEQLKAYSAKQIFEFGESDSAKFTKTDPGPFGRPGDVYFEQAPDGGALGTVPVTPEVQAQFERFVTQYLLPALENKGGETSPK